MKKKIKNANAPKVDPYLEGFMAKLIERLVTIEKKIDALSTHRSQPAGPEAKAQPPQPPRRDRVLYEAICADCHKVCEVPFKPSEDRAVYCKECFARRKSGSSNHGMPKLTPVALPPKPVSKLNVPSVPAVPSGPPPKKAKKSAPAKKSKKKR